MSDVLLAERVCYRCKVAQPLSAYPKANPKTRADGLSTYCRECWREIDKDRRDKKRAVVTAYKLASGCVDCGYDAHPDALQFDHLPGEVKEFNIGTSMSKSLDRIMAEISKCEVVCANCHAIRTAFRRELDV